LDLRGSRVLGENPKENRVEMRKFWKFKLKKAHFRFYIAQCLDTISAYPDTRCRIRNSATCVRTQVLRVRTRLLESRVSVFSKRFQGVFLLLLRGRLTPYFLHL